MYTTKAFKSQTIKDIKPKKEIPFWALLMFGILLGLSISFLYLFLA